MFKRCPWRCPRRPRLPKRSFRRRPRRSPRLRKYRCRMLSELRRPRLWQRRRSRRMHSWFRSHWRGRFGRSRSQWMLGFPLAANLAETGAFRTNLPQDFEDVQTYAPDAFGTKAQPPSSPKGRSAQELPRSPQAQNQCLDFA